MLEMKGLKIWRVALGVILCAAIGATAGAYRGTSSSASSVTAGAQDVAGLDRRISALEQRFYAIESSLNRLEQQMALSQRMATPPASTRDLEINLLRGEIEALERRLREIECGLVKLDERTTTPAAREARKRAGAISTDPCRLNAEAPLRLSTRP